MNKIITLSQAKTICKQLKTDGKSIILVGGCFDIFHYGHFVFLKTAKELGNVLFIALESDQRVKELKGDKRPITPINARAEILSAFTFIDYVITLPYLHDYQSYNNLTISIKPDIIAVTANDPQLLNKQKQAKAVDGKVIVIPHINTPSTSEILEKMTTS